MILDMPAAILAGGASKRMGVSKAMLPYGRGTLVGHQIERLTGIFHGVWLVVRETPDFSPAPARLLFDTDSERSAMSGLTRALEECEDRVFVLAVDLPLVPEPVLRAIARRGLKSAAPAVLPEMSGELQPLAGVWSRAALPEAKRRAAAGDRSLRGLAEAVGAEAFPEDAWRRLDPSGNTFSNLNTIEDWIVARERA